jgi:hypothetical protein
MALALSYSWIGIATAIPAIERIASVKNLILHATSLV